MSMASLRIAQNRFKLWTRAWIYVGGGMSTGRDEVMAAKNADLVVTHYLERQLKDQRETTFTSASNVMVRNE